MQIPRHTESGLGPFAPLLADDDAARLVLVEEDLLDVLLLLLVDHLWYCEGICRGRDRWTTFLVAMSQYSRSPDSAATMWLPASLTYQTTK